jgi:hypothetical protein
MYSWVAIIPKRIECEDKDMAAMLEDITKQANVKYFVNVLQHGGDDVT